MTNRYLAARWPIRPEGEVLMRLATAILVVVAGPTALHGQAGKERKPGEELVKAQAVATRPDVKNQRVLTIMLAIKKGYHIIGNPVGCEELKGAETVVRVSAGGKPVAADVKYPLGKRQTLEVSNAAALEWRTYEGTVTIRATFHVGREDASPQEVEVWSWPRSARRVCLPSRIRLRVP
jgi:hypothetical protein